MRVCLIVAITIMYHVFVMFSCFFVVVVVVVVAFLSCCKLNALSLFLSIVCACCP